MRIDTLQQFVKLRRELTQEKEEVLRRLAQINQALGEAAEPRAEAGQAQPRQVSQSTGGASRAAATGASLRELVLDVLREGAKTKEQVLNAVQQRGYKFATKDPLNSLGVILYGRKPKFNRVEGKFSLPEGTARVGSASSGTGRRQISAAGRARIAEAQRQRWAGTRNAKQSTAQSNGSRRRTISPAARKAIAEAARRRWAAAKRAGRNRL